MHENISNSGGDAEGALSARLVVILGGARSGKSTFAERLALQSGRRVAYIATALASDDDMRDRIARHQAQRPTVWRTIEEPLQLATTVQEAALHADVILLDCVTIWLSNWLFMQGDGAAIQDDAVSAQHYDSALQEISRLLAVIASWDAQKTLLLVSNEVGLGIVPSYASGRIYRDILGLVNQRLAAAASQVYLMVAGLGVDIKRLHNEATI
ncbi:MAG TPA: bifunctional adenosylcobinamide kinase/adenosylcobinamide-phosphate guanylyltransferase [Dictyobacter sp.]|jgi:adenosylcobinamide kinase/adenosylcobinamide-phosphate guanylyltransferase|nr:bifunctional adenosylcobinamide kinase/adenosylcobinamide-phosphate guanylyltransferase [Dictyobacter sp.]